MTIPAGPKQCVLLSVSRILWCVRIWPRGTGPWCLGVACGLSVTRGQRAPTRTIIRFVSTDFVPKAVLFGSAALCGGDSGGVPVVAGERLCGPAARWRVQLRSRRYQVLVVILLLCAATAASGGCPDGARVRRTWLAALESEGRLRVGIDRATRPSSGPMTQPVR